MAAGEQAVAADDHAVAASEPAQPERGDPKPDKGAPTVVAEDVCITYRVYEDRRPSLRRLVAERFKPRPYRAIEAVQGVSFTAHAGEAIGVIGENGSGKSTLMRAVAGLMPVTSGRVWVRGEPALLGVNAALQPALSGRRNIMIGGLALGLSKDEIEDRFDDIVDFSGLRKSIDLPLRTYSSGMRARLHFALATAVVPDILLIDEALAVGDKEFRARSRERIEDLKGQAGTIFIVSHSMREIKRSCKRVIWLNEGRIVADGPAKKVIEAYDNAGE